MRTYSKIVKRLFTKAEETKKTTGGKKTGEKKSSIKERFSKRIIFAGLIILFLIAAGGAGGFYYLSQIRQPGSDAPLTPEQSQKVIDAIGKLIELPAGEEPILATVSDVSLLPNEPFYEKAQNGDRVLVFKSSKMAILYRPSANKIIRVGTVSINEPETASATSSAVAGESNETASTKERVTIAIYNGTKTSGYAKTTGDSLEADFENIEVVSTSNAAKDYTKTLIVNLSGKNRAAAATLAEELGGDVGEMPEGETKPTDADILIILGE